MEESKKFNYKGFVSLIVVWSFILLFITGIVMYIKPPGRIANWTNWKLLGLTKAEWDGIHTVFGWLFLIAGAFHLYFNWKVFTNYIKTKVRKGLNLKRELYLSSVITLLLILGIVLYFPPISSIVEIRENISESWGETENNPPIPHAEGMSLKEFTEKMNEISITDAVKNLKEKDIKFENEDEIMGDIAERNGLTPIELYRILSPETGKQSNRGSGGAGGGYGRMTLKELCERENLSVEEAVTVLKDKGINVSGDDNIREISSKLNIRPSEVADILKNRK